MFAGVLSQLASLTAQPALLAIGAGVLAGAVVGTTMVVTGILPGRAAAELTLLSCYENGVAIGKVEHGQSMLVTARSADGAWLEVYVGVPGMDRGWAPASSVRATTSLDALPVVACTGNIPLATLGPPATPGPSDAPTPSPSPSPTTGPTLPPGVTPSPSPKPTRTPRPTTKPTSGPTFLPPPPPPPTPSPTSPSDLSPPTITNFIVASPGAFNGSYFIGDLPCSPPSATIRVTVTDPSGVNYVRLYYRPPGMSTTWGSMTPKGSNIYEFVITPPSSWPSGEIGLWVQAGDNFFNQSAQISFGNPNSTLDSSLFWDPICIT